jgi:hypothetical protein
VATVLQREETLMIKWRKYDEFFQFKGQLYLTIHLWWRFLSIGGRL